ncbi:hypothetical protein BC936DRAFT_141489 [Jimgerdemannia flammicorona]|uniref:Uncharacterized protein n=2 Tax=Jimgerdemannia flammicorona TaxID=994334 RepID=A0A433A233_9FUNG|nr:hypothetical protein BC936DRAFT_141489 [Jimgerdemannia flammicorona]RUS32372.1 hypothetical protein BC938DRAFT_475607 [Jimgerdemannia flammicorona]
MVRHRSDKSQLCIPSPPHTQYTMSAAPVSRTYVLHLYRTMLRNAGRFSSYNFRDYAARRTRDGFRAHAGETNPERVAELVCKAEKDLKVLERQSFVNSMYAGEKLVVEDMKRKSLAN